MEKGYENIIQSLNSKLELINAPDYIKFLYYKKIKLLEEEMKMASKCNINYDINKHIRSLDDELNILLCKSIDSDEFISDKLVKANKQSDNNHKFASKIKRKAISYLLTLSIMLTSSLCIIEREKDKTREVLFNTHNYTLYDDLNLNDDKTDYLPKTDSDTVLIMKYSPWNIEGVQGKRAVYTYKIDNINIGNFINNKDLEMITKNFNHTISYEYKYKNELRDYDRYEEPIYKVIYQTQDYNDYIVKYPNIEAKALALLLCNILIYMLMININNGPIIESLFEDIEKLKESDKLLDIDYEIITKYRKKLAK